MTDEVKKMRPKLDLKDIKLGGALKLKLKSAKEIKTGETQYGTWYLWAGEVTDTLVREGPKGSEKPIENYTGEVIFFPTAKLHESLIEATGGVNSDVEVEINKTVEEGDNGALIKRYVVKKISNGGPQKSSITTTEMNLMNEIQELINDKLTINEDLFIKASQEPHYENKITEERAKQLFIMMQNGNN